MINVLKIQLPFLILFSNCLADTAGLENEKLIFPSPPSTISPFQASFPNRAPSNNTIANQVLFLMHTGNTAQGLTTYKDYINEKGSHDFELLEQIGLILLDQGFRTRDPETVLLTMFGAGISLNEKALYILEEGMTSSQPELQMIALNFLSKFRNDRADDVIHRAMRSNYLLIRLEAAFNMAARKDKKACAQTEALMAKVDEELWPAFPQIYAACGDSDSTRMLRKMLAHSNEEVRAEAITGAAKNGRDDLLPVIRRLASHHEQIQQEACAHAFGILKDENSTPKLMELAKSCNPAVKLVALKSLFDLGRLDVRQHIEALAKNNDPFATSLLGKMPGSEKTLNSLMKTEAPQIALNAAIALLELRDPSCLPIIAEVLIKDARDLSITRLTSAGKSLSAWKIIPSTQQNFKDNPVASELSLHLREAILVQTVDLPEKYFLALANRIFEYEQNDLVPALVQVLENHASPSVIDLLKKQQQKAGAPLIRNYCNLALYKLKEPGPYADNLREWVTQQQNIDLIRFRPIVPWTLRKEVETSFELTPQETSRLLVDSFEAFVASQDDRGIDMLISVIQEGNAKNKYALIGLLMRAIQ